MAKAKAKKPAAKKLAKPVAKRSVKPAAKKRARPTGTSKPSQPSTSRRKPTKQPLPRWTPIPIGAFLAAAAKDGNARGYAGTPPPEHKPSETATVETAWDKRVRELREESDRLRQVAEEQRKKEEVIPPVNPERLESDALRRNDRRAQYQDWSSYAGSQKTGKPEVLGQLKIKSPRLQPGTRRPHVSLINTWRKSIKHSEFWRARDGSYHLIATFKGSDAWEQMERAFRRLPIPAYYAVTFFLKKPLDDFQDMKAGESPPLLLDEGGELALLKARRTPTFPAEAETWPLTRGYVYSGDRTLYEKKFGLAVAWPVKKAKHKKKRKQIDHGPSSGG